MSTQSTKKGIPRGIPDGVIEAIDDLITKGISDHLTVKITQAEIIESIFNNGIINPKDRKHIFFNGWLDIEKVYAKRGITVEYDKSAIEGFSPNAIFTFSSNK